ncbi:MAG: nuclease [Planctomycetota bacterium]
MGDNRRLIRIATFNLNNLALPEVRTAVGEISRADYLKKIGWIAGQLDELSPDIVGFQEVWHREALVEAASLHGRFTEAEVFAPGENPRFPVVGLASKLPILEVESIEDFPEEASIDIDGSRIPWNKFRRPVLKARLALTAQQTVTVFVLHLKSKRPDIQDNTESSDISRTIGQARSLVIRACEAAAFRAVLLRTMTGNDEPVVVLGDLNDATHSVTSEMIMGTVPRNAPREVRDSAFDELLYSAVDFQTLRTHRDVYYTHKHEGHVEFLDHILVSQEFWHRNPRAIGRVRYMRVYNDHLVDKSLGEGSTPSWSSDHGQVLVGVELFN